MAYRDPPTEDRTPILVIPREEFSWWQRTRCAMGWHSLKACQFVILRQVRYARSHMIRGTLHYDPGRVICRCCGLTMDRSRFKPDQLLVLSTFEHALFSDDWEDARGSPHPKTFLVPGEREAWYDLEFRPRTVLG